MNFVLASVLLMTTVAPLPSCLQKTNSQPEPYSGSIAVESLANHLTVNANERKLISGFIIGIENDFHIRPQVLFQENDYLAVVYTKKAESGESVSFYFSNYLPTITEEYENGKKITWLNFNGYLSYSQRNVGSKYERLSSWYERPSKYGDIVTSGYGFREGGLETYWLKIINLREFNWHQKPKQP